MKEFERRKILKRDGYRRLLYKFFPVLDTAEYTKERYRDVVCRSRLWLSAVSDFNDPFDSSATLYTEANARLIRGHLKSVFKSAQAPENMVRPSFKQRESKVDTLMKTGGYNNLFQESYNSAIQRVGVCCFSRKVGGAKNTLMWSHYSSSHKGVCFVFDTSKGFDTFNAASPVDYAEIFPKIDKVLCADIDIVKNGILRKSTDWKYEEEARIFEVNRARNYIKFNPTALVGIVLGYSSTEETRRIIHELIAERKMACLGDVRLYKAKRHPAKYQLQIFKDNH